MGTLGTFWVVTIIFKCSEFTFFYLEILKMPYSLHYIIFWHHLISPLSSSLTPSFCPRRIDAVLYLVSPNRYPESR